MTFNHLEVIVNLTRREVAGRYRGSMLGILWSLLTPLLMLAVYTFMFGTVLRMRWAGGGDAQPTAEFALILFVGLIFFQTFSEMLTRAPTLILANVSFVKKVVFPLEILPVVALAAALFHMLVSFLVMLIFLLLSRGSIPLTAPLLPIVVAPFMLLLIGLSWFFAAAGVYFRDISQVLNPIVSALMFLSPIFVPAEALPSAVRPWLTLNPISIPVEQARQVLIFDQIPNWSALAVYTIAAAIIAGLGFLFFQATRKGFADVL
ncbi:ABC transporter permease [Mesorhizobium sp. WSM4898]|uniref:ABC transporter permease n=1 Tax=Mesorhizobium sp. WSM4898 TaxID=3038544 RepID=UPI0024156278|nr:ABC transporter permease [Mesorhizobium sp. WSM4898]MDG4908805.1 ABC transporter permease [Mesorhizobium sp. WSM4898]WIE90873.1 ABC transporter permease [Mesorhizobium sp. WSM4875]